MLTPCQVKLAAWLGRHAAELTKTATVGPLYQKPAPAQTPAQGRAVSKPKFQPQSNIGSATGTGLIGGDLFKRKLSGTEGMNGVAV